MTLKQAMRILEAHNRWRRDSDGRCKMQDPSKIGEAIDVALIIMREYGEIYDMDRVEIEPYEGDRV